MSDDLDDLNQIFDAVTPAPDANRRAENIALAQKNYAALQETVDGARPMSNRPMMGLWTGVEKMMTSLTSRAGLTACTALVAVGLIGFSPVGDGLRGTLEQTDVPVIVTPSQIEADLLAEAEMPATAEEQLSDSFVAQSSGTAETLRTSPNVRMKAAPVPQLLEGYRPKKATDLTNDGSYFGTTENLVQSNPNTETYATAPTNPVTVTAETPVSTFSIDVDTASYSVIRNMISTGQVPPADVVRIEEMVNYFTYDYPAPTDGAPFRPSVAVSATPWNPNTQLVTVGLQGALPEIADRPPLNLVFLLDTSGSMNQPNKLPLLKQSFRLMLGQLRPEDQVAIVTYAGSAGRVLDPTPAGERETILAALDQLGAGGSTAGQAGLQQAYATVAEMAQDGDVSRVILATDGDFNVGLNDPEALKAYIAAKRDSGAYLSVLGFGRGNLDDATMQALAQNGNGQAAYIDRLSEAQKVLVDQLTGNLFPIANDVKIQVEFNPATVAEYRLIGYETRALRREDFNNDKVDAGEIGAGHSVTAIYEVTPVGSPTLNDPLRYGSADTAKNESDELGFLRLRYKTPGTDVSELTETPILANTNSEAGFATAIAGFGQLLRGSPYLGDWSYDAAIALANANKGEDPYGYRAEAIQLMRLMSSLSTD
jgi:Ca-activated chloride channel family protein